MSIPWAIEPQGLMTILEIAARETRGPEAIEAELGRPLANTQTVTVRDRVAVLPVKGPIFRHANAFARVSGATSADVLARDFHAALNNPEIDGIVLSIASPGGEVAGIHELAEMIHGARGRKPIRAYIQDMGASAAYWLAAATDHLTAEATARVGSIGIITTIPDASAEGTASLQFVSSQSPRKNLDPKTPAGAVAMQQNVDAIAEVFVSDVARFRGVSAEKVLSDFGGGGTFVGADAVRAGLIDQVGSLEGTIAAVRAAAQERKDTEMKSKLALALLGAVAAGLTEEAAEAESLAAVNRLQATETELQRLTGTATPAEALGAVAGLVAAAKRGEAAMQELAQLKTDAREREVAAILDSAKDRVAPADRQAFLEICGAGADGKGADPAKLRALVDRLPKVADLGGKGHDEPTKPAATAPPMTPEASRVLKLMGVTADQVQASNEKRAKKSA